MIKIAWLDFIRLQTYKQIIHHRSTMGKIIIEEEFQLKNVKFPKSGSLASLKTQEDPFCEKEFSSKKILDSQKERLISLITCENVNMKEAAKKVHISYSTAKKVFKKFRRIIRAKEMHTCGYLRAEYQVLPEENLTDATFVRVISTVAGYEQRRHENIILISKS